MKIFRLGFLCTISSLSISLDAKHFQRTTLVRYTEEKVNGILFTHRIDIVDGKVSDRWAIDNNQVTPHEYEERILEAEKAERKLERKELEKQRRQIESEQARQQEFALQARLSIQKKCIAQLIAEVEHELDKVKDRRLEPYYRFEPTTIESSAQFQHIQTALLAQAQQLIESNDAALVEKRMAPIAAELEALPARLRDFFRSSVKHAIDTCNDTRLLKEFLEIIV